MKQYLPSSSEVVVVVVVVLVAAAVAAAAAASPAAASIPLPIAVVVVVVIATADSVTKNLTQKQYQRLSLEKAREITTVISVHQMLHGDDGDDDDHDTANVGALIIGIGFWGYFKL